MGDDTRNEGQGGRDESGLMISEGVRGWPEDSEVLGLGLPDPALERKRARATAGTVSPDQLERVARVLSVRIDPVDAPGTLRSDDDSGQQGSDDSPPEGNVVGVPAIHQGQP
jgi:hypothetical protein